MRKRPEPLQFWVVTTVVVASLLFLHACASVVRTPGLEAGPGWTPPPAAPQQQTAILAPPAQPAPQQTEIARTPPPAAPLPPNRPFGPPSQSARTVPDNAIKPGAPRQPQQQAAVAGPRRTLIEVARQAKTSIVNFESAPFPYEGAMPGSGRAFLDVNDNGRRGHRTSRGRILWEDETFKSSGVLLHVPQGFDPNKPGVIVVFFHGHGATIGRDVQSRQQVPAQISRSSANAVLVAPQFASNAADSSPGKFWKPGGFARFLDEAAKQLAAMHGDARAERMLATMPVVIVGYSGGYLPLAWVLRNGDAKARVRGVVLLDALYGELDTFANWKLHNDAGFLISAHLSSTRSRNIELQHVLGEQMSVANALEERIRPGSATFIAGTADDNHRDFVSRAWGAQPIADILNRMPDVSRRGGAFVISQAR